MWNFPMRKFEPMSNRCNHSDEQLQNLAYPQTLRLLKRHRIL